MNKDYLILRELASKYFEIANSDKNRELILLHKKVNDLKNSRPIVLIDEIPWHEMNINEELTMQCVEKENQEIEFFFKTQIYRWKNIPVDTVFPPYYAVKKIITSTGIGVNREENEHEMNAASHTYVDQIKTFEDLEKLHYEKISYDKEKTMNNYNRIANIFGDILPVKIVGDPSGYGLASKNMDDIVNFRGLDMFFYDFIERPEFMHALIGKLTDIYLDRVRQYNELELLDTDSYYNHSTSALTNDLKPNHLHPNSKGVWGRSLAQIFASVGPDMHDEFDIQYAIKAMEPFGLVYYGCCEPLDTKIHIVEKIPNLRKISITPWANVDVATEIIGKRYVVASKPTPSALAVSSLDEVSVRKELSRITQACKRNGCTADIVLKDITTVCNNPQNLFKWAKIAMEIVQE